MARIYADFKEVEDEIKELAPKTVYKYRTWDSDLHKSLLTEQKIWFSHPFDLNDPLDARPTYVFDKKEIESEEFYKKLRGSVPMKELRISSEEEADRISKEQWERIKKDPQKHFDYNREVNETREKYDPIGIFSTSNTELEDKTWQLYGGDHSGYALGFDTSKLAKSLNVTIGIVNYSDNPFPYSFLGKNDQLDEYLYKTNKWSYENEFRFITFGVGTHSERLRKFDPAIATEIVLGYKITPDSEKEILEFVSKLYPKEMKIYKTEIENGKFAKRQIHL